MQVFRSNLSRIEGQDTRNRSQLSKNLLYVVRVAGFQHLRLRCNRANLEKLVLSGDRRQRCWRSNTPIEANGLAPT